MPSPLRLFLDYAGSRVLVAALTTLSIAVVTRTVPVEVYGTYVAAIGFAILLMTFLDLGNSQVLVREAAGAPDPGPAIRTYLHVYGVLTLATLVVGLAGALVLFPAGGREAALVALGLVVASGPGLLAPIGQVTGRLGAWRTAVLLQAFLALAFTALLLALDVREAVPLVLASVAGSVVATAYGLVAVRRWVAGALRSLDRAAIGRQLRSVFALGLATVMSAIYYRIDGVLVLRIDGPEESGYYGIAYRILDQARIVPTALLIPLGPIIAAALKGRERVPRDLDAALLRLSRFGGPALAGVLIAVADLLVLVISGPRYEPSGELAVILAVALAFAGIWYVAVTKAIMAGRERMYLGVAALGLAVNVALNVVLIPPYGATGAAVATTVTEVVVTTALVAAVASDLRRDYLLAIAATLAFGVAAAAVKLAAAAHSLEANVAASAGLVAVGAACAAVALRELRGLPNDVASG